MPRHPPCALKNLTTKITKHTSSREPQKPTTTSPHTHEPHTKCGTTHMPTNDDQIQVHKSWKLLLIFKMLASTMQFSNNNPQTPGTPPHKGTTHPPAQENTTRNTKNQSPCYFRTQQCATHKTAHTLPAPFHNTPPTPPKRKKEAHPY